MIILYCPHKDCPNSKGWKYTGKKKYPGLVGCSYCGNKTRIPKTEEIKHGR